MTFQDCFPNSRALVTTVLLLVVACPSRVVANCPFCSAVSQTLRQEMSAMDTVAIATIKSGTVTDSEAQFLITEVFSGDKLVQPKQEVLINYFGKPKDGQKFLVMGVDPPDLLWSSPLPVSEEAVDYIEAIQTLPEESLERLKFYMNYLEHEESLLARDAYDEFASAPYSEIKALKPAMNRKQLLGWIQDTSLPPDRKRLYLVMLGVCGEKSDADLLEDMLRSDDPYRRAGLDSMIACYATLKGDAGLDLIDELFLKNKECQYADTYAAIMALRFHGTDGGVIKKDRVLESMRLILDRPELADLVIPDLARWEDWSQIEKLEKLFTGADEKSSWVRVPVINYLRACPHPKAEETLKKLKEIDPAAYKRATSFFPMPKASQQGETDGTSTLDPSRFRAIAADAPGFFQPGSINPSIRLASASVTNLRSRVAVNAAASEADYLDQESSRASNRALALSVISMVSVSLGLTMWLSLSGAGNSPLLAWLTKQRSC